MADRMALMMVAVVAIVGIISIVQLMKVNTPMIGYVVSGGQEAQFSVPPPQPEPVPFALSKCGNTLCELGFEDNSNCPEDCPIIE